MKKLFLLYILFSFVFNTNLFAQECNIENLVLKLDLASTTINYYQPLRYTLILENVSSEDKVINLWGNDWYLPIIEYQEFGDSNWLDLPCVNEISAFRGHFERAPPKYILKEGKKETFNSEWLKIPKWGHKKESSIFIKIFEEGKNYRLRAKAGICFLKEDYVYSNIVNLSINSYSTKDRVVIQYLENKILFPASIYGFNYENGYLYNLFQQRFLSENNIDLKRELEVFIEKFPKTQFTPWVKLFLASLYISNMQREERKRSNREYNYIEVVMLPPLITESKDLLEELEQDIVNMKDNEFLLEGITGLRSLIKRLEKK